MNKITYPLKFDPLLQENIWGGDYLKNRSSTVPTGAVGESWEISDYKDETTPIKNEEYRGKALHQIIEQIYNGAEIPERFPLLLKILAPESELSVQVHPTDDYTSNHAINESGKAEAWYILDAPEGSFLYLGLTKKLNKELIKQSVEDNTLTKYLNKVYVKQGDVVSIPHGTIHSLCPSIKVFEIQQSSNITYRLYDWGRVDKNGKGRQLHISEALDVINFDYLPSTHIISPNVNDCSGYKCEEYIKTENFTLDKYSNFESPLTLPNSEHKVFILSSLNSKITISTKAGKVVLDKFDSCLIPALSGDFIITGNINSEFLLFS